MGLESRVFFRLSCRYKIRLSPADGSSPPFTAEGCDISTDGVGLLTSRPLQSSAPLSLELFLPGSWKSLNMKAAVCRQMEKKPGVFFTGMQFVNPDSALLKKISDFITRSVNFTASRWAILLLALGFSWLTLLRTCVIDFALYFSKTEAGKVFSSFAAQEPFWHTYLSCHAALGILFIILAAGVFLFRPWARKLLLTAALVAAGGQIYRLLQKMSFLSAGSGMKSIYGMETLLLGISAALLFLLIKLGLSRRFDSYLTNLNSYVHPTQR